MGRQRWALSMIECRAWLDKRSRIRKETRLGSARKSRGVPLRVQLRRLSPVGWEATASRWSMGLENVHCCRTPYPDSPTGTPASVLGTSYSNRGTRNLGCCSVGTWAGSNKITFCLEKWFRLCLLLDSGHAYYFLKMSRLTASGFYLSKFLLIF